MSASNYRWCNCLNMLKLNYAHILDIQIKRTQVCSKTFIDRDLFHISVWERGHGKCSQRWTCFPVLQRKRPVTKQDKGKNLASDRAMHDQCILRSMCSITFYAGSEEVIKYSEVHEWEKNTDKCYVTGQPEKNPILKTWKRTCCCLS